MTGSRCVTGLSVRARWKSWKMSINTHCLSAILWLSGLAGLGLLVPDVHCQVVGPAESLADVRFETSVTAVINARHWDAPQAQWIEEKEAVAPRFFDAAHRFLLVRFPGCAQTLNERLGQGQTIASVKLLLTWEKQEWLRVKGYNHRGYKLKGKPVDAWHARVWGLKQPWDAHPDLGPTWNASINGAHYWRAGGALGVGDDRFEAPLGQVLLAEEQPAGAVDVSAVLASVTHGRTLGERLRNLEDRGFLLDKAELCGPHHGEWGLSTGNARLWIKPPMLVVTLRPGKAESVVLPQPADIATLAAQSLQDRTGGTPTTVLPENLAELAAKARRQQRPMPEWMQRRVLEVRQLDTPTHTKQDLGFTMPDVFESGDSERYRAVIDGLLKCPPGWFRGHSHVDFLIPLLYYGEQLPDVVRYHLRKYFEARWLPPYSETELRHRVAYHGGMATLNHQSQFRSEGLLAGELLGMADLTQRAKRNLTLLNRQMIFSEGTIQERGDSFYLGISLGTLQMAARFSRDPLMRLKAGLAVEKILFETNSTYHPGLKRRVSRISRRYRVDDLLLAQCVPRGILHTLSKKGVLIETDKLYVHPDRELAAKLEAGEKLSKEERGRAQGIPTLNFHPCAPARVALLAPWGRPWESNVTDAKPLPFLSIGTDYVRGHMRTPVYNVTWLGKHYGMSSMSCDIGSEWPNLAVWKRSTGDATSLDDLGVLCPWPYMNDLLVSMYNHQEPVGVKWNAPSATLQHGNRMIHVVRPPERIFSEMLGPDGVRSFKSRILAFLYGETAVPHVWINGKQVKSFPAPAKAGDVITLDQDISYVGLIPLPATDAGRRREVVIDWNWPRLTVDSYVLDLAEPRNDDDLWRILDDATAGWVVELGDRDEHETFGNFQQHLRSARLDTRRDPEAKTLSVTYKSGSDTLEHICTTAFRRKEIKERYISPEAFITTQRVNGESPWPDTNIDLDCPLGQMGKTATLTKGGAVLETREGQVALLRIEPISGIYEVVNPLNDPQPFVLSTPEGVVLQSEGDMSCGRVTVQPEQGKVRIDCYPIEAGQDAGLDLLEQDAGVGGHAGHASEAYLSRYTRPESHDARADAARSLLVSGLKAPLVVVLNDTPLPGPFERVEKGGRSWFRVPMVRNKP